MSVLFNPFAKFWRNRPASGKFRDDEGGIVTVQMVLFSIMLFGGIGLMMDFGRAYSAHSQMQGYIDQVALAAAEQLDGKDDAIARATTAANAVIKSSAFITGDGTFKLQSLTFMTDAPSASDGTFSPSQASTFNTTTPELAKFVMATATSTSVTAKMLNFASNGGGVTEINIAASAVATSRRVSCGGMSPMVMCNPFEGSATTSWQDEMENGIGYRMKLTANERFGAKPTNTGHNQIRLGLLKSPDTLMNVRNTICSTPANLPNNGHSTRSLEMQKDICMLATVNTGLSCVNDQVTFKAAHPEAITTGLGVPFDMYDDDMAAVVNASEDFLFTHTFPASHGLAPEITRSSLFYPDPVAAHGRMNRTEFDMYLDNYEFETENKTFSTNFFFNNFIKNGRRDTLTNMRAAYGSDSSIQWSSRQNHPFARGQRTEWGPAPVRTCLDVENCDTQESSPHPTIYNQVPGVNEVENYAASYYAPYLLKQAYAANPGTYDDWWNAAPSVDVGPLVNGHMTYYGFYKFIERQTPALMAEGATDGHDGVDGTGAWVHVDHQTDFNSDGDVRFDADDIHYGTEGIQAGSVNYPSIYGAVPAGAEERRVQRVTIVNCDAAESYSAATGDTSTAYSDAYVGEIVDVVDLFMITPPQVEACDPVISNDPETNYLCPNSDVAEVHLDVEMVDSASINPLNFDARFYAVLIH